MEIVIKGADFSALGLGNTRWIEKYILNANITDATQKVALRALYSSFVAAGIDKKLEVLRLMFTTRAAADRLNVLNPLTTNGAYYLDFTSDNSANHTLSGWTPGANSANGGVSNYQVTSAAQLANFHMHVFNTTAESVTTNMMGFATNVSGNSVFVGLARKKGNGGLNSSAVINTYTTNVDLNAGSYDITKTGLLSAAKNGTSYKLYDGAVVIASATVTPAYAIATAQSFSEGTSLNGASGAKIFSIAYGSSSWTDADETALNNALVAFKTAIGA